MSNGKRKSYDYETLAPAKKSAARGGDGDFSLIAPSRTTDKAKITTAKTPKANLETNRAPHAESDFTAESSSTSVAAAPPPVENQNAAPAARSRINKEEKRRVKIEKLLTADHWMARNGHGLTFAGIFLFTVFVFFRPYELVPGLEFTASGAMYIALFTLAVYVPTQLVTEGNLTMLSTEVKCVLVLTAIALLTVPIAKDPPEAWRIFNDTFIKAVLIFIVMVNVVRTRRRLNILLGLSFAITLYVSYTALSLFLAGEFKTEGYRVSLEIKGLFNNPNDMALHLVTMLPIAVGCALAARNKAARLVYFGCALLFLAALMVTYSRGGFLGLTACAFCLVWKLGRDERAKYTAISAVAGILFVVFAPGNYGLRLLSIVLPGLDPVGSADARREGLITSIIVTIRNPWGIGIGNSPIFGHRNLQTHNAYTQVSSELGLIGLAAYVIFIVSPLRKLNAIEQTLYAANEKNWFYFMSVGLQASLVGYLVSSFFLSIAYNWYIYYLVAYAVAFRRIFQIENKSNDKIKAAADGRIAEWQTV